ncbi:MAG: AsmA-like C-terminal domain-containing protein [Nitrospira sp.]|nr:AsmA-like C-terminal domain-containing protein [Nitrospira sp.]
MDQPTATRSMKIAGRIAFGLLLFALLYLAGLLLLPWVVDRPSLVTALLQQVEQRTGHRVTVEDSHLRMFPSVRLELLGATVHHSASPTTALVGADRVEIAVQWLPLLEGRVIANDVIIDRPRLTVRRQANGNWSLDGNIPSPPSSDPSRPFAILQFVRNLLVVEGTVTIVDEADGASGAAVQITLMQGLLTSELTGRRARLHMSGEVPQPRGRAAFTWEGSLTQSQEGGRVQAEGDLRLHRVDMRHVLAFWSRDGRMTDGLSQPAQLTAHLRWLPRAEGADLLADDVRAELSDVSVQGSGSVLGLGTDGARFSTTVSAPPVSVARLLTELPSAWLSDPLRAQFKDHAVDGVITVQSMSVSGDMVAGAKPTVNGLVDIQNGRFTLATQYPPVEALSATISYDAVQVRVTDVRAQCGPIRLRGQDLLITQWATDPHVDVKIQGTAPVRGLAEAVRRLDEFPLLRDLVTELEQPVGDVEMIAHVMGRPLSGQPLSLVDADLVVHGGGGRSRVLPVAVRQVEAHVTVTPTLVAIEHLDGRFGPAAFDARGSVALVENRAYSDVTLAMDVAGPEVQSWLEEQVKSDLSPEIDGSIRLQATITGRFARPRIKGLVDLRQAGFRIPERFTKPLQTPAAVEFEGQLDQGNRLVIRHLDVRFPPVKVTGGGAIDFGGDMSFSATVSSGKVAIARLPKGIVLGPVRAGLLDATLQMEGQVKDRSSWRTSGQIKFDEGTIKLEAFDEPIRDAFVTLRFDQDRIQIPRMAFRVGASDMRISGSIGRWADSPKARLVVESSQIDLDAFRVSGPRRSASARPHVSNPVWSEATLNAFLFADHVYYKKFLLTDLSAKISWDRGLFTVERISGDTNEGHLAGQLKVRANGRRIEHVRSTFRASGIPVDRVLSPFQAHPVLSGWLTTSGKIQAELERGVLLPGAVTSRQPVQVLVEDGRIYQVPVLSTLLSVLNLPAVLQGQVNLDKDGLPFDRLKLVGSLSNGVVTAKEFLLDSPILKISGTGRYDIVADEFDMVLATSPLGSYSDMLKRIPLFGHLLAGDRQGFDTAVFELKGSADRPDLRYLPTESLMTGVKGTAQLAFDLLVNALTLPQKAYSMVEEGITGGEEEDF